MMKARWIRDSWEKHMLSKDKTMERRPDRGLGGDNFENLVVIGDTIQFPACDALFFASPFCRKVQNVFAGRCTYIL